MKMLTKRTLPEGRAPGRISYLFILYSLFLYGCGGGGGDTGGSPSSSTSNAGNSANGGGTVEPPPVPSTPVGLTPSTPSNTTPLPSTVPDPTTIFVPTASDAPSTPEAPPAVQIRGREITEIDPPAFTPSTYRYVRVQRINNAGHMTLAELHVYNENLINVAINKPNDVTSLWDNTFVATSGNDGDNDSYWASNATEEQPYFQIDLQEPVQIQQVSMVARPDFDSQGHRTNFAIWASNDGDFATYTELARETGDAFGHQATWTYEPRYDETQCVESCETNLPPAMVVPNKIRAEQFDRGQDLSTANTGACGAGAVDRTLLSDLATTNLDAALEGTCVVSHTQDGEWLEYDIFVTKSAYYNASLSLASTASTNGDVNLALGKTADYDSIFDAFYAGDQANDGNASTIWASGNNENPYYQIDLGRAEPIGRIELVARQDLDQPGHRTDFEILGANTPNFTDAVVLASKTGSPFSDKGTWVAKAENAGSFRFFRVQRINNKGHITVAELRLFNRLDVAASVSLGNGTPSSLKAEASGANEIVETNVELGFLEPGEHTIRVAFTDESQYFYGLSIKENAAELDIELGEQWYEQLCATCHGDDGAGDIPLFSRFTELSTIAQYIADTMPLSGPEQCVGECAQLTAAYIATFQQTELTVVQTQRLKRLHYYKTLDYLFKPFGLSTDMLSHPEDPRKDGFPIGNQVSPTLIFSYHDNANILSKAFVQAINQDPGLIGCDSLDVDCSRRFYFEFAEKAYRRPLQTDQIERLNRLFALGLNDPAEGLGYVVGFILQSPAFLYYLNPADGLSDHTLANQLAYLLWNEPPDTELLALADINQLRNPRVFDEQVERMINAPKGAEAINEFVNQWLSLQRVNQIIKDDTMFPGFTADIVNSMASDLQSFVSDSLAEPRSFETLMSGSYQLSDELSSLLSAYGSDVKPARQGLLSQPGVLAFLSGPGLRSPIKRGVYVLENLLCDHRSPPANINLDDQIEQAVEETDNLTVKEVVSNLTGSPGCQICHSTINPVGFGFENYDSIGLPISQNTFETVEIAGTQTIDSIELGFNGVEDLQTQLLATEHIYDCVSEKAINYANTIGHPSAAQSDTIRGEFALSADIKALFRTIALTLIEAN